MADFVKAIEINPNLAVAYYNRGNAYDRRGETDKAEADFKKAKELGYKEIQPINSNKNDDINKS